MTKTSSSHVGEEQTFYAPPRGLQPESKQDYMEDFTTTDAINIFFF